MIIKTQYIAYGFPNEHYKIKYYIMGFFLLSNYEKNHLNSDGQQFYQYEKKKQLPPTSNHWTQKLDSPTVLTYKTDSHDFVESDTKYHKPNPNPLPTELKEISTKLANGGYEVFQ